MPPSRENNTPYSRIDYLLKGEIMISYSTLRTGIDIVVSLTVGSIVEDTAKLVIPKSTKALSGWALRIGSKAFGSVIGGAVSMIFMKQIDDIVKAATAPEEDPNTIVVQEGE